MLGVRKSYPGVNVILTHSHIICDPYLGLGICATKRIPYACIDCINAINLPWDPYLVVKNQPRYSSVTK